MIQKDFGVDHDFTRRFKTRIASDFLNFVNGYSTLAARIALRADNVT